MTKDVLVSISGKHIDIMEDPTAGYETGDDSIEVVTPPAITVKTGNITSFTMRSLKERQARSATRSGSPATKRWRS